MAGGPAPADDGFQGPANKVIAFALTAFAAFGGILYGYDTGVINGIQTMDAWIETFGTGPPGARVLTTSNQSLVVSILSAGNFFGALGAGQIADRIGRRWSIITACIIFSAGVGIQLISHWISFIVGRFVAGLGVGLISCLVPMYQGETSPKQMRGLVIALYQWAITIGIFLAAIVNNSEAETKGNKGWRTVVALQFAWAAIIIAGMLWLPETPRFLMLKGRHDEARRTLARVTTLDQAGLEQEFQNLLEGLEAEAAQGKTSYKDLFVGGEERMWKRTMTGVVIQIWQQLTGINFIFYYGTTFFKQSGIADPFMISIVTNVVNVAMSIPGIFLIDRVGRRALLIGGAFGMAFCQLLVAIIGVTKGEVAPDGSVNLIAQRVLIAFVCVYIAFFASSWGPCPWVVCAEVFPSRLRAKGMSLSLASNWLWNFAIGYATPYLVNQSTAEQKAAGLGVKVFFVWGSACIGCAAFSYFFVMETKGLSLEQVDDLYRHSSPIRSAKYAAQIKSGEAQHLQTSQLPVVNNSGDFNGQDDTKQDIHHV